MADIADLTDDQLIRIYFRPRDKDGKLDRKLRGPLDIPKAPTARELNVPLEYVGRSTRPYMIMFWQVWLNRGASQEEILARWLDSLKRVQVMEEIPSRN